MRDNMDNTLGDFLNDEPLPESTIAADAAQIEHAEDKGELVAEPVTDERPRGPDGKFIKKEETGVENAADPIEAAEPVTPTEQPNRLPPAEYAALRDERGKRQEEARLRQQAEHERDQLRQYVQSLQAQQQPQTPPDMFEDPDGFKAHLRQEILRELEPALNQHRTLTRAEMSEIAARQKFEDYDATVEVFKEAMATNPFLLTQLQQAPDPAVYAYNAGKQFQAAKAYGNEAPPSREQIEAEIREQIKAELSLPQSKAPSTFAGDRSVGSRSGPAWTGPASMRDLLS